MTRQPVASARAKRFVGAQSTEQQTDLIVEAPLTIQRDGQTVGTTMGTPRHDEELAVGFLHAEGSLVGTAITGVTKPEFGVVSVNTAGGGPDLTPRIQTVNSSCGLCGAEAIEDLGARLGRLPETEPWNVETLTTVGESVRARQELFDLTGSVHAAAVFDRDGNVQLTREDIGRHNAVDKVVGSLCLAEELPATDRGLFVSGRASFEMVQKAWAAGFSILVAVSGPSALAVEAARQANLQLVAFARGEEFTVFSPEP